MSPKFCVKTVDRSHSNETCWGLGYKVQREIDIPSDQPLKLMNSQKFDLWFAKKRLYRNINYNDYGDNYSFIIKEKKKCSKLPVLYYTDQYNRKYYLFCLEEVLINLNNEFLSLKNALEKDKITIDEITNSLTQIEVWYDGGTRLYEDKFKKYSKYGFTILRCHASNESKLNNDIYIGPSFMTYEKGFCK